MEKLCETCNLLLTCKEAYVTFIGCYDLSFEVTVNSLPKLNKILFLRELSDTGGIASTKTCVLLSSNTNYFKFPHVSRLL